MLASEDLRLLELLCLKFLPSCVSLRVTIADAECLVHATLGLKSEEKEGVGGPAPAGETEAER